MTNTNYGKLGVGSTLGNLKDRATALEGALSTETADRKSADSKLQANNDSALSGSRSNTHCCNCP